jgi:hypothetical protein
MGVYEAAQMSNVANWSKSISIASFGLRSQFALIFRAFVKCQPMFLKSKSYNLRSP